MSLLSPESARASMERHAPLREGAASIVPVGSRQSAEWHRTAVAWLWGAGYLAAVSLPLLALVVLPSPPGRGAWWDFAMGLGFGGLAVMGAQFGLTARFHRASAPFGIDILYRFHRWMAVGGVGLVAVHALVVRITAPELVGPVLPPGAPWHMTAGRVALLLFVALTVTSLWRRPLRLEYDRWRIAHATMAVAAVLLAVAHVVGTGYYSGGRISAWIWGAYAGAWLALGAWVRVVRPWRLLRRPYRVRSVSQQGPQAWTLQLEPEGHPGMQFRPGQFGWVSIGRSPFAAREHPFSFSSSAARPGGVAITVKELGDFTATIGATTPGTVAYVDGPFGTFTPDLHPGAPGFVFIAGGVGIAPMMSMLRTLRDRGEARPLLLVQACNREGDLLFADELAHLEEQLRLRAVLVLREPPQGWPGETGLVTGELLRRVLPADARDLSYFLCGPEPMTELVQRELRRMGVPLRRIHLELFDMA